MLASFDEWFTHHCNPRVPRILVVERLVTFHTKCCRISTVQTRRLVDTWHC